MTAYPYIVKGKKANGSNFEMNCQSRASAKKQLEKAESEGCYNLKITRA